MKKILLVVVIVATGIAIAAWYFHKDNGKKMSFRTALITRGDLVATISATGTVEPEELGGRWGTGCGTSPCFWQR